MYIDVTCPRPKLFGSGGRKDSERAQSRKFHHRDTEHTEETKKSDIRFPGDENEFFISESDLNIIFLIQIPELCVLRVSVVNSMLCVLLFPSAPFP
jgi:hypothetical protein